MGDILALRPRIIRSCAAQFLFLSILTASQVAAQSCTGDCDGDGSVAVRELVESVNVALGKHPLSRCRAVDRDDDRRVGIDEMVAAVDRSISGCVKLSGSAAVVDAARASTVNAEALPRMYVLSFGTIFSGSTVRQTSRAHQARIVLPRLELTSGGGAGGGATRQLCGPDSSAGLRDVTCIVEDGSATLETVYHDCRTEEDGGVVTRNGTERITVPGDACMQVPPADAAVTVELEGFRATSRVNGMIAAELIVEERLTEAFVPDGESCDSARGTFYDGTVTLNGTQRITCSPDPAIDPTCDASLSDLELIARELLLRQTFAGPGCDRTLEANGALTVRNDPQGESFAQTFVTFRQGEFLAEDSLALSQNGRIVVDCLGEVLFVTRDDSRPEFPSDGACPSAGSIEIALGGESGASPASADEGAAIDAPTDASTDLAGGGSAVSQTGGLFEYAFRAANGQVYQVLQNPAGDSELGTEDVQITTLLGSPDFVLRCDGRDERDQVALAVVGTSGEPFPLDGVRVSSLINAATPPCFNPNGTVGNGLVCIGAECGADCRCPRGGCALPPFTLASGTPLAAQAAETGDTCRGSLSTYAFGTAQPTVQKGLCTAPPTDGFRLARGESIVIAYDAPPTAEFSSGSAGLAIDTDGDGQLCRSPNTVVTGIANRNDLGRARIVFDNNTVAFDVNADGAAERVIASCQELSLARCGVPEPPPTPTVIPLCPGTLNATSPVVGSTTDNLNAVNGSSCADGGNGAPDATYGYRAATGGCYRIDTLDVDGLAQPFDTLLYVRRGADNCNGSELACNDNAQDTLQSELFVDLETGQEVVIIVDGTGESKGDFRLTVQRIGQTCAAGGPTDTPTASATPSPNDTSTATPSPADTPTGTATRTSTSTPSPTATRVLNLWTSNGPEGASIRALVIDPLDPSIVYAAVGTGDVFKTSDGGDTWTPALTGLPNILVQSLAIDPMSPQTLYAGTFAGGVFKTTDGGDRWSAMSSGLTNPVVLALAVDASQPQTVYAATFGGGVFKSTDGAANWEPANAGMNLLVRALAIDPETVETLYAGTDGGVFKSTNGGESWTPANTGITGGTILALAIDPSNPQTLYAGTQDGGVFKSTTGGANWSAANDGLSEVAVGVLVIDPSNAQIIYAGTGSGVFKTTNGGGGWNPASAGLTDVVVQCLAIDPTNRRTLYAGTEKGGIFETNDGAGQWRSANTGLTIGDVSNIFALAIDPEETEIVYAGTDMGVFRSTAGGERWGSANTGMIDADVRALAVEQVNPQTLYAATLSTGVFKSVNGAQSWNLANVGLGNLVVRALAIDPADARILYAATEGGVYKSLTRAGGWTAASNGLTNSFVRALAMADSQTLYAGTNAGVFASSNAAGSWSPASKGLTSLVIRAIAVDPANVQTVYAGTEGGPFKSTDGAASWEPLGESMEEVIVRAFAIDPTNPQTIYLGSQGSGVLKSTNGGESWFPFNAGLSNLTVFALAIDPQNPSTVYAGTAFGAFRIVQTP